jgi:hypothetical protein
VISKKNNIPTRRKLQGLNSNLYEKLEFGKQRFDFHFGKLISPDEELELGEESKI